MDLGDLDGPARFSRRREAPSPRADAARSAGPARTCASIQLLFDLYGRRHSLPPKDLKMGREAPSPCCRHRLSPPPSWPRLQGPPGPSTNLNSLGPKGLL